MALQTELSSSFPLSHRKILAGLPENLSLLAGAQSERKANCTAGFRHTWKPSPKSTDSRRKRLYTPTITPKVLPYSQSKNKITANLNSLSQRTPQKIL
uniref:Uncharacterized protein n=1 Tax=Malurus cyaneus samueli TaxID=2593467 RepID=A0A8C5T498_9PASS